LSEQAMSTSGEQPSRPLTRRELRQLRAQGGEAAVREALDAERGQGAAGGVAGSADRPAEPSREPNVVATSSPTTGEHPPLTRKELRRLRTNEVPIVTPEAAEEEPVEEPETIDDVEVHASDPTILAPTTSSTEIPTLDPSFGQGVGRGTDDRRGTAS